MRVVLAALALASTPAAAQPDDSAPAAAPAVLPRGTVIPLTLRQQLSTQTCAKGDLFEMAVAADVLLGTRILVPTGSRAVGEVTRCERKGAFGRSGKLEARALYAVAGDRTICMTGALSARGRGAPAETALTTVAVGVLSFVVTGRSAVIPEGSAIQAALDRDVAF